MQFIFPRNFYVPRLLVRNRCLPLSPGWNLFFGTLETKRKDRLYRSEPKLCNEIGPFNFLKIISRVSSGFKKGKKGRKANMTPPPVSVAGKWAHQIPQLAQQKPTVHPKISKNQIQSPCLIHKVNAALNHHFYKLLTIWGNGFISNFCNLLYIKA